MNEIKEALGVLFEDPKKRIIAILLVVIGILSVTMFVNTKTGEIKDELKTDEVEIAITETEVMANQEQIEILWKKILAMDKEINELRNQFIAHKAKKKH